MREAYKTDHQLQLINAIKANDQIALKQFYMSNYFKIEALVLKNIIVANCLVLIAVIANTPVKYRGTRTT